MSHNTKKVFVFEFLPYHAHNLCLHSRLLSMLAGHHNFDIHYYLHPSLVADDTYIPDGGSVSPTVSPSTMRRLMKFRLLKPWIMTKFLWMVRSEKPDIIIFNSLEKGVSLSLFKRLHDIPKIALVHNPGQFSVKSDASTMLLCMNRYIFDYYGSSLDGYCLSYFGPEIKKHKNKKDLLTIGVPGSVSFARRNYELLLETAQVLKNHAAAPYEIRFNIIGNITEKDGPSLQSIVKQRDLSSFFCFHNKINDGEFLAALAECDALLPLITEENSPYFLTKNSATFSHSARYIIPMIMTEKNAAAWAIPSTSSAIYSNHKTLADTLMALKPNIPEIKNHYRLVIERSLSENNSHLRSLYQSKLKFK